MTKVLIGSSTGVSMDEPYLKLLKENGFEVNLVNDDQFSRGLRSDDEVAEILQGASATIAWGTQYTSKILSNLPDLRVIARRGVGFDRVDVAAATANNIVVTITPEGNYEAVAEHAMSLIFTLAKSLRNNDINMRSGSWLNSFGSPIRGSILGIVGLGRIGKCLAVMGKNMNMHVVATESMPDQQFVKDHDIDLMSLDDLFRKSDYISLHCPLTDQTRGMVNKEKLSLMKSDASIVNTARGGLIVESDLIDALKSGSIASAGLDVFEQEPISPDNLLTGLDNVILTPHMAGNDHMSRKTMSLGAASNIIELHKGGWPEGSVVNDELKGRWTW
jgi:D-3-phosphoglycerate dehydrogenase